MLKSAILKALEDKYNAQISEADATLKIYFENSVGIGEHPDILESIEKELAVIAEYEDQITIIRKYFS